MNTKILSYTRASLVLALALGFASTASAWSGVTTTVPNAAPCNGATETELFPGTFTLPTSCDLPFSGDNVEMSCAFGLIQADCFVTLNGRVNGDMVNGVPMVQIVVNSGNISVGSANDSICNSLSFDDFPWNSSWIAKPAGWTTIDPISGTMNGIMVKHDSLGDIAYGSLDVDYVNGGGGATFSFDGNLSSVLGSCSVEGSLTIEPPYEATIF